MDKDNQQSIASQSRSHKRRLTSVGLAISLFLGCFISSASASVVAVPPGLEIGDRYRLVFVTADDGPLGFSDIAVYNTFVTKQAHQVPSLAAFGEWRVLGSAGNTNARRNTRTDPKPGTPPVYRIDGIRVAEDYEDLWDGRLENPISIDQDMNDQTGGRVNTGSNNIGTKSLGLETQDLEGITSVGEIATTSWMKDRSDNQSRPLYAMSSVIILTENGPVARDYPPVGVPEPSRALIGLVGLMGALVCHRRRKA